ncbi:HTH-type transcriptional regulator KipR [compost metagenome]
MRQATEILGKQMGGGVQSLARAISLLRIVSAMNSTGLRLSELVAASGLPKPTTARLMSELLAAGLVMRNGQRRFQLGPLTHELGVTSQMNFRLQELCRPSLTALSEATGETTYLKVRSGAEVFCLDLATASRKRKAQISWRGSRAALGTGACGLALLSFMSEADRSDVLFQNAARSPTDVETYIGTLRRQVERTRRTGYALSLDDVFSGMSAIGIPILDRAGWPIAALSVSMPTSELNSVSRDRALAALQDQERRLRHTLSQSGVVAHDPLTH